MYIAIEGVDTAGKSTQIKMLKSHFKSAIITKEPGGTDTGKMIRDIVLNTEVKSSRAEFLLFLADRAEHIQEVVKPNPDKLVISDRSAISGIAYALIQKEISQKEIIDLNNFVTQNRYPEKVFLLMLTKEELQKRLEGKRLDGIESRGFKYLLEIQDAMIKASQLLEIETIKIDASLNINEIHKIIKSKI